MLFGPFPNFTKEAVLTLERMVDVVDQATGVLSNLGAALTSRNNLVLENLALRQQLAAYQRQKAKPTIRDLDRVVLAAVSRLWTGWRDSVFIVQLETVVRWHHHLFKCWWRLKSKLRPKPRGRPRVTQEIIDAIRFVQENNLGWGAPKIWWELTHNLGYTVSQTTVTKYMIQQSKPPSKTWRTFLENHANEIWAIDFLVQHTVTFDQIYVFTVKQLGNRKVIHMNATAHPTLDWVKQQLKQALWDQDKPRFILHDNDAIFGNYPNPVNVNGKKYRNHLDRWLKETMGIQGIRTPFRSPKANSIIERFHRSLRQECLNHFLFFSVDHLKRVLQLYKTYFNQHRIHQGLRGIPDPQSDSGYPSKKPVGGKIIAFPHLGGLVHDFRWVA